MPKNSGRNKVQEPFACVAAWKARFFCAAVVGTFSTRMVLAQSECRWALRVLCGIVFFEAAALKT